MRRFFIKKKKKSNNKKIKMVKKLYDWQGLGEEHKYKSSLYKSKDLLNAVKELKKNGDFEGAIPKTKAKAIEVLTDHGEVFPTKGKTPPKKLANGSNIYLKGSKN